MDTAGRYTGAFDVGGGRKLFLSCSGSGTPTVILEAGADAGTDSWFAVQPWLATTTRPDAPMGADVVPGINEAIETEWQHMQIKLAHLVPGGNRIVATKSDHMIPASPASSWERSGQSSRSSLQGPAPLGA